MKKLLFLTLNTFSATGGIEKVCRAAGKALHEISVEEKGEVTVYAMYDKHADVMEAYFPSSAFLAFGGSTIKFVLASVRKGLRSDAVILSHINLLFVGYLIKMFSPKTQLILLAHGIEVWQPLSSFKMRMLKAVDLFLPVSKYTSARLQTVLAVSSTKLQVLNNCLDPFMTKVPDFAKEERLRNKYGIAENNVVLFTLTRLKFSEQYKGYDKVIEALPELKQTIPDLKYLIAGRYDKEEKARLDSLIAAADLQDIVIFTGFVADEDVEAHFAIADIYIMPSTGEGFGIVFIEALFYSKPVIAGNQDGSADALCGGKFGLLVNPCKREEIIAAVLKVAQNKAAFIPNEEKVQKQFGFQRYKKTWHQLLYAKKSPVKITDKHAFSASPQQLN